MRVLLTMVGLLTLSNIFMTFAWHGAVYFVFPS